MEYRKIFGFDFKWNWKSISLLAFLAVFPNLIGMYNYTAFGIKVHFFQYLIFLAAAVYGPFGGAVSGAFGSMYTAIAMNNPYIVVGNILLGAFAGIFIRLGYNAFIASMAAFAIQLPFLFATDIYLAGMPFAAVMMIAISLLVSNSVFAGIAALTKDKIKKLVL